MLLTCSLGWLPSYAAERAKTDLVILNNGDQITGRILSVQYGILQLNSQHSGTVSIEWPSVVSLQSVYGFRVERIGGGHAAGLIATRDAGKTLAITESNGTVTEIPMDQVSHMVPFDDNVWDRIYGSVSLGYNFTKSTDISQASFQLESHYEGEATEAALSAYSLVTRDSSGSSDQDQLLSTVYFLRESRNFWGLIGELERNQDLGINARVVGGVFLGRRMYQSEAADLVGIAGLVVNQEWAAGGGGASGTGEAVLGGEWRVYRFSYPKISLDTSLLIFPSLTDAPRVRGSLNVSLTYKLTSRFSVMLSEFGTWDSKPPQENAQRVDFGLTLSLSYDFGAVIL
jgi:hypothetical protein